MKKRRLRHRREPLPHQIHRSIPAPANENQSDNEEPDYASEDLLYDNRMSIHQRQQAALSLQSSRGNHYMQRAMAIQRAGDPMLRVGSRSPAVQQLQTLLGQAGFPLAADGIFGPLTKQAVIGFQQSNGLAPDGIVGPATWGALKGKGGETTGQAGQGGAPNSAMQAVFVAKLTEINQLLQAAAKQGAQPEDKTITLDGAEAVGHTSHDWIDDASEWAGQKADSAGEWVGDKADSASEWVGDKVDSATEWAGEKANAAGEWVGEKADAASGWVNEQVNSAGDWVNEKAGAATEWVDDKVNSATQWAGEKANTAGQWANDKVDQASDWAEEAYQQATNVATEIKESVEKIVGDIRNVVNDGIDKLLEVITNISKGFDLGFLPTLDDIIKKLKSGLGMDDKADDDKSPVEYMLAGNEMYSEAHICDTNEPVRHLKIKPNINMNMSDVEGDQTDAPVVANDSIKANMSLKTSDEYGAKWVAEGDDNFGNTTAKALFPKSGISVSSDWYNGLATMTAELNVIAGWNVNWIYGRTSIVDANSDKITKENWRQVVADLDPDLGPRKGAPSRTNYFSNPITEAHEKFHVQDMFSHTRAQFPKTIAWLESQTIDVPIYHVFSSAVEEKLSGYRDQILKITVADINTHMKAGGEDRAYEDGYQKYVDLVAEIKKRAKREPGWMDPPASP